MAADRKEIKVRYNCSTYIARCQGKVASCTAGAKQAAEAVARKVMFRPAKVVRVDREGLWRIEE